VIDLESNNFETLTEVLKNSDTDSLEEFFYKGSKYLELLHKNDLYVTNFNPDHIKTNGNSVIFERTDKMTNRIVGNEAKSNVEAFTSLMVGAHINYTASLLPFSKIRDYYKEIKYAFSPTVDEYVDKVVNEGQVSYFHDFVDSRNNLMSSMTTNSRVNVKGLSTPQGRAFSEKNENYRQAAFANVLVISAMISLILLVAILTYVILK
jgi:hypothetical protein